MDYTIFYCGWVNSPFILERSSEKRHWFDGISIGGHVPIGEINTWCEAHLKAGWKAHSSAFWSVDDADDAMLFRLRWC